MRVAGEIGRVVPRGSTVYVLGGTSALGPGVDAALRFLGYQVVRLGGLDRFATAVSIAHDGLADPATDFLVTGSDFADALAAGPAAASVGGAVLLTDGARMPVETAAYLQAHPATLWALGGPAASAAGQSATAVVGVDRYDTAVQVAVRFFPSPTIVGVATGAVPADGLAGGAFMGAMGGPLLLTQPTTLPAIVTSLLGNAKTTVGRAFVFGGPSAIADVAFAQVQAAMAS